MTWILVKLALRLAVFVAVFWVASRRSSKITIQPRWAIPLVAGVFGLLNTGLYWLLKPVLHLATFGAIAIVLPFAINGLFLWATARAVARKQWLRLDGVLAPIWLALALTAAHGVLWLGLDYIPAHV